MKSPALLLGWCLALLASPVARAQETPPQPTVITALHTEVKSSENDTVFVLTGNVRVEATALTLTCDRLEIVALRSANRLKELKGSTLGDPDKFKSLDATGKVRIVQPGRTATCDHAEILPNENKITLEGKPFVELEDSTITGDKLVLYRGEKGIERMEGTGIQMTGPPIKDLSEKAPKSPKTPAGESSAKPETKTPEGPKLVLPNLPGAPEKKP